MRSAGAIYNVFKKVTCHSASDRTVTVCVERPGPAGMPPIRDFLENQQLNASPARNATPPVLWVRVSQLLL